MKTNQKGYFDPLYLFYGAIALVIVLFIGSLIFFSVYKSTNKHDVTFTVNKTERVQDRNGQGAKYMVYTDNGVYQNTDSVLNNKYNSADLYNELKVGKKYTCTAVGFRNGFFSMFENLIRCAEVK